MTDPTRMTPAAGGTASEDPGGGPDWRAVTIYSLVGLISLLVIVLLLVRPDDGDRVTTGDLSTTTTAPTTAAAPATTAPTTSAPTTTTAAVATTAPPPSPPTTTTSTSRPPTTTTTTAPPTTISPIRCTGQTGPNDPEAVAEVFYDAWRVGDRSCAEQVATDEAVETLFVFDGSGAQWTAAGCGDDEDADGTHTDCVYLYDGGSATFEMRFGPVQGWEIFNVRFAVD